MDADTELAHLRAILDQPDPEPLIGVLERHTVTASEAAEALDAARTAARDAQSAVPEMGDDSAALLTIDEEEARAAAAGLVDALEGAAAAQAARRRRPAPDGADRLEIERASASLRTARLEHADRGRRLGLRLLQAAGVAAVLGGTAITMDASIPGAVAATAAPLGAAGAWSVRSARADARRLGEAERAARLVVSRLFGEDAADDGDAVADPASVLAAHEDAWRTSVGAATAADAALAEAQRRWLAAVGDRDHDRLEEDLALAARLRTALAAVERATAAVAEAERRSAAARLAWSEAATAAGCPGRTIEEAEAVLGELHERRLQRQQARTRLAELEAAQRLAAARRHIDALFETASLDVSRKTTGPHEGGREETADELSGQLND